MHVFTTKRPMGVVGWLLLAFILGIFIWSSRRQLVNAVGRHLPQSKNSVAGEWVGTVDITNGYHQYISDAAGDHNKAAIRFTLEMYDGFLERYKGRGEILIQGEAKPRALDIADFWPDKNNGRFGGTMSGDWGYGDSGGDAAGHTIKGWLKPGEMTFSQTDGLEFHGTLRKGTDAEYKALCQSLEETQH